MTKKLSAAQHEVLDDLNRGGIIETDGGLGWPRWEKKPEGQMKSRLFPKCITLMALEKKGLINVAYDHNGRGGFGQCIVTINDQGRGAINTPYKPQDAQGETE